MTEHHHLPVLEVICRGVGSNGKTPLSKGDAVTALVAFKSAEMTVVYCPYLGERFRRDNHTYLTRYCTASEDPSLCPYTKTY